MPRRFCKMASTVTAARNSGRSFPPAVSILRLAMRPMVVKNPSIRSFCSVESNVTWMSPAYSSAESNRAQIIPPTTGVGMENFCRIPTRFLMTEPSQYVATASATD